MTALVVDASVAVALLFDEEITTELHSVSMAIFEGQAFVPPIFLYEVANVLAQRSKVWTFEQVIEVVELLESWPISIDLGIPTYGELAGTAMATKLTSYDAAYVALAKRLGCSVATRDKAMAEQATLFGVATIAC